MNNYKSVRNRLFTNSEVELKSETVELGVLDDLKKIGSNLSKLDKALDKEEMKMDTKWQEYKTQWDKLDAVIKQSIPALKTAETALKKASALAKELGVKPDSIEAYKSADQAFRFLSNGVKNEQKKPFPKIK